MRRGTYPEGRAQGAVPCSRDGRPPPRFSLPAQPGCVAPLSGGIRGARPNPPENGAHGVLRAWRHRPPEGNRFALIEGTIESLDSCGIFSGWLRDTEDPQPVMVEVRHEGQTVARAVATLFRDDLLRGLHGHGHYGFQARLLATISPGSALFELFLPRRSQGVRTMLTVPKLDVPVHATVEALLQSQRTWTAEALVPYIACLGLAEQHASLGTARFIDMAYRFALRRWPSAPESQVYASALDEARLSTDGLLAELLTSRERQDIGPDLPSPWDAAFPFVRRAPKDRPAKAHPRKDY